MLKIKFRALRPSDYLCQNASQIATYRNWLDQKTRLSMVKTNQKKDVCSSSLKEDVAVTKGRVDMKREELASG